MVVQEVEIDNDLEQAYEHIVQPILQDLVRLNYSEDQQFAIRLALEEAVSNAYHHGNKRDTTKKIAAKYEVTKERVMICVADQGPGFVPDTVPDPRLEENLELPSGRGVMLIRAYMDEVVYNETGNEVCMIKRNEPTRSVS